MGKSKILSNLKGSKINLPTANVAMSDRSTGIGKSVIKQSDTLNNLGLNLNTSVVKPREQAEIKSKSSKIETYNEQGELVKTLSPLDRAKYNANKALESGRNKDYLGMAKNVAKAALNVQDITLEPITQLAAKAVSTVSKSGGMIMKNLSSLDEEITRDSFSKGQQKILDNILDSKKKGTSPLKRTEYGSEYGFNKNEKTLTQIKRKLFDDKEQLTNIIGNARVDKDNKKARISDVYNFDKENNSKQYLDKAKKKLNPNYKSADDKNNMSILERAYGIVRDKIKGSSIDTAIANNLRTVGAKVNYTK